MLTALFAVGFPVLVLLIAPAVILNDKLYGRYRGWNRNYRIFAWVFKIGNLALGIRTTLQYEAYHDAKKNYVFILNHTSYYDIPNLLLAINQPIRVLGKTGPNKLPLFGYYYKKSTIMVNRISAESRLSSLQKLKHYLRAGVSIVVFPEGTFNQTNKPLKEFYNGAFSLAIETQTNIKPILMLNSSSILPSSGLGLSNGQNIIIYLPEISVQNLTTADTTRLKQYTYSIMESALQRYNAAHVG